MASALPVCAVVNCPQHSTDRWLRTGPSDQMHACDIASFASGLIQQNPVRRLAVGLYVCHLSIFLLVDPSRTRSSNYHYQTPHKCSKVEYISHTQWSQTPNVLLSTHLL
jgi:hypothetical protein